MVKSTLTRHIKEVRAFTFCSNATQAGLDVVWPDKKQTGLIDSLFRNFYIPPVVFAMFEDADGESIRECVDGKQVSASVSTISCPNLMFDWFRD